MPWTPPTPDRLFDAIETTWPSAASERRGVWTLHDGAGGGKRVSATVLTRPRTDVTPAHVTAAIEAMRARGSVPLFMVRTGEEALDVALAAAGLHVIDPVNVYASPVAVMAAHDVPDLSAIPVTAPLSRQREIWAEGGIGPGRLAVMARVAERKTHLLARIADRPAGTGFVAMDGEIAMLHALEIAPDHRRQGAGRALSVGAARWAAGMGAQVFALMTTADNRAANALYHGLGMQICARYHYRIGTDP